jgi:hypothetical protein
MIDDSILHARIPRLGTITVGRGVERTSQRGTSYSQPRKASTLVFHTDDEDVAQAVARALGGQVYTDSPTWAFDVETDRRSVEALALPAGFRQALELWRAAECSRRCDGVTMSTLDGKPESRPCLCAQELAQGRDRACTPSTILPLIVELDVERFGVWELRSNAWGTASSVKGTIHALAMVGATAGSVPVVVSMVDRKVRDTHGDVHSVVELTVAIARSHTALAELAGRAQQLDAPSLVELPAGATDEGARLDLMQEWADLQGRAHRLGLREQLAGEWRAMFGESGKGTFDELDVGELEAWVTVVRGWVVDAEAIITAEQVDALRAAVRRDDSGGDSSTPAPPVAPDTHDDSTHETPTGR